MNPESDDERLGRVFHPFAFRQHSRVQAAKRRFVHYTSAAGAISILKKKEVWLRNATTMNDFMEVEYGLQCVTDAYQPRKEIFRRALEQISPGLCAKFEAHFSGWMPLIRRDAYLLCVSEHLDSEDTLGRLSMWRAYSKNAGVALVLNSDVFFARSGALGAYSGPVDYEQNGVAKQFDEIAAGIIRETKLIKERDPTDIHNRLFNAFLFAALCTKHPGFHEELEWRVCFMSSFPHPGRLRLELEDIGGTPQLVAKLPLQNVPDEGLQGLAIPELLDRVIIGPTDYPDALHSAFVRSLKDAGVSDAEKRVLVSEIPLRR